MEKKFKTVLLRVELIDRLRKLKVHPRQSYGEVIENILDGKK